MRGLRLVLFCRRRSVLKAHEIFGATPTILDVCMFPSFHLGATAKAEPDQVPGPAFLDRLSSVGPVPRGSRPRRGGSRGLGIARRRYDSPTRAPAAAKITAVRA